jgi:hypothetical protein
MSNADPTPRKPREEWDREDLLDYLEGWHTASGLHYRPRRDPMRTTKPFVDGRQIRRYPDTGFNFMTMGGLDRAQHREATGL